LSKRLYKAGCKACCAKRLQQWLLQIVKPFLDEEIRQCRREWRYSFAKHDRVCKKLYESLAVGLSLDEAVCRARLDLFEMGCENISSMGIVHDLHAIIRRGTVPRSGKEAAQAQVENENAA